MQPLAQNTPQKTILVAFGDLSRTPILQRYASLSGYSYIQVPSDVHFPAIANHITSAFQASHCGAIVDNPNTCQKFISDVENAFPKVNVLPVVFETEENHAQFSELRNNYRRLGLWRSIRVTDDFSANLHNLKTALTYKTVFFYGAPLMHKTLLAKRLASATDSRYVDFNYLRSNLYQGQTGIEFVNSLVNHCKLLNQNLVVDGFVQSHEEVMILEELLPKFKVIHLKQTKDEVQAKIKAIKDTKMRASTSQAFQRYIQLEAHLIHHLSKKEYYLSIEDTSTPDRVHNHILQKIWPKVLYLDVDLTKPAEKNFIEQLSKTWGDAVHINLESVLASNTVHRRTEKSNMNRLLQSGIYYLNTNIILTGFPNLNLVDLQDFEAKVTPIQKYIQLKPLSHKLVAGNHPSIYYLELQKLVTLEHENLNPKYLLSLLQPKHIYYIVSGPLCVGKTSLARSFCKDFEFTHIEWETYAPTLKEKIGGPDDGDQLPLAKILAHVKQLVKNSGKSTPVFDGIPYEGADLDKWITQVGAPTIINLKAETAHLIRRYRKKNSEGSDLNAEQTEDEVQRTEASIQKNVNWLKGLETIMEKEPGMRVFQVDFNSPLISVESLLPSILKPRVLLVADSSRNAALFKSLSVAFGLSYIDFKKVASLRNINPESITPNRDIVIANYPTSGGLISDDINWIEKNIGTIRYVGLGKEESKEVNVEKMVIEKPPEPEKKKKIIVDENGEEKEVDDEPEQEQPPEEDEDGKPKKPPMKLYEYEWSKTGVAQNLSQWFLSYKKPVKELLSETRDDEVLWNQFNQLLENLNQDRNLNIYHLVK